MEADVKETLARALTHMRAAHEELLSVVEIAETDKLTMRFVTEMLGYETDYIAAVLVATPGDTGGE